MDESFYPSEDENEDSDYESDDSDLYRKKRRKNATAASRGGRRGKNNNINPVKKARSDSDNSNIADESFGSNEDQVMVAVIPIEKSLQK